MWKSFCILLLAACSASAQVLIKPELIASLKGAAALAPPPGMVLWLDATTIGVADNTAISTWADTSGNGNDFENPTGDNTKYPVFRTNQQNGQPGVDFDGSNDYLLTTHTPTVATVYSIFIVLKADNPAASQGIFRLGNSTGGAGFLFTAGGAREVLHRTVAVLDDGAGTTSAEYWSAVKTAAPLTAMWVNGSSEALSNDNSTMVAADLGGFLGVFQDTVGLYFAGLIFEVLYYETNLSTSDRQQVEAYLAAKWGI